MEFLNRDVEIHERELSRRARKYASTASESRFNELQAQPIPSQALASLGVNFASF